MTVAVREPQTPSDWLLDRYERTAATTPRHGHSNHVRDLYELLDDHADPECRPGPAATWCRHLSMYGAARWPTPFTPHDLTERRIA